MKLSVYHTLWLMGSVEKQPYKKVGFRYKAGNVYVIAGSPLWCGLVRRNAVVVLRSTFVRVLEMLARPPLTGPNF